MEDMRGPALMTSSLAQLWSAETDPREGRRRKGHKRKGPSGVSGGLARAEAEEQQRLDFLVSQRATASFPSIFYPVLNCVASS